jgi:type IV fimbrial biogenesis protein FimT
LIARGQSGFSLYELLITVAVIGILAFVAIPFLLTYLQSATVNWASREIQSALNRAKMLAVTTRQNICVQVVTGGYRFRTGNCAGATWRGPGTDAAGTFRLRDSVTVSNTGSDPIFTPFGIASQTGTFTVNSSSGQTRTVTVLSTGRVTIP